MLPRRPIQPLHSDVDFRRTLGKRVRTLRLLAGMTQDTLAHNSGMYRTYLARIEAGSANPTVVVIAALAGALKVPAHALFLDPEDGQSAESNIWML